MNILALDLGQFNSMASFYNASTKEHRFSYVKPKETLPDGSAKKPGL